MSQRRYTVKLLTIAEEDFTEIISYVAADRPAAAAALATKIEKKLQLLARNPRMGRTTKDDELARLRYRFLVVENYLIFYTIEGYIIYVHRILHGARDYVNLL